MSIIDWLDMIGGVDVLLPAWHLSPAYDCVCTKKCWPLNRGYVGVTPNITEAVI